jgi:RimJ/RimL family protein N-acetyltransferase
MTRLATHDVVLDDGTVRLRPLAEADFDAVVRWFADPEVMYYSEGKENPRYSREEIEGIYRGAAEKWDALLFAIETREGKVIGETWLERMNLQRALKDPPDRVWRIDIMIGEKDCWGKGYGRRAVRLLLRYAFETLAADRVGAPVFEFNHRSLRMLRACGMRVVRRVPGTVTRGDGKFADLDLEITRDEWLAARADGRQS